MEYLQRRFGRQEVPTPVYLDETWRAEPHGAEGFFAEG